MQRAAVIHRAYSFVTVKGFDLETRAFSGIATSPVPDRLGDSIASNGVKYKSPLPLLLYHDSKKPVGETRFGKATADGTPFNAVISTIDRPGIVKDRLDEAVDSLTAKPPLIRAVSIGFLPLEDPIYNKDTGGYDFPSIEVVELSMVVIPAHQDATIDVVKSLDLAAREIPKPAGVSATRRVVKTIAKDAKTMKKSIADQIVDWTTTMAAKTARINALIAKSSEDGATLDEAEAEEHDTLDAEITSIEKQLERLHKAEAREKAAAVEVKGTSEREGLQARAGATITVERTLPKGILFTRAAMCFGMARGNVFEARELAKQAYGDNGVPVMRTIEAFAREMGRGRRDVIEKTAVTGGATSGSHYLDDMVPYNVMNDFIEFLRPGSILGKFGGPNPGGGPDYPTLRRVGFNERVSGMSTGYVAAWKGEGLPAIPTAAVTFNTTLLFNNVAALAILTKEAIRFSNPSAEARVRDDLGKAVNTKLDVDFIDPAKAASGTTSPASITNAVIAIAPTGTTAAFLVSDMATLLKQFTTNDLDASDVVLIMSASQALQLSMMTTTLGAMYFPNISMKGGNFRGIPVIASENLQGVGSPGTNAIVAVKASEVYLADDGVVTVDASDQASVEMVTSSSQSAISGTGASLVSLWQTGAIGLMATREITWKMRRSTAVAYISPAAYVA